MIHHNQIQHQRTNKVRHIPRRLSYTINQRRRDRQIELPTTLTKRLQLPVVQLVVLLDLLFDIVVIAEEGDQLVTLSVTTDL